MLRGNGQSFYICLYLAISCGRNLTALGSPK